MNRSDLRHYVVGLSGGVDSSVAAARLSTAGHTVTGLFMKNWEEDDADGCASAADLADARAVAERLGMPLRTVNFATEYWDRVFAQFLAEYRAGRTPNPDVLCNREIKFKEFLDHARGLGAERVATGHYARIRGSVDGLQLLRAVDTDKDQSYFLHALGQEALAAAAFPLGELTKPQVRGIARQLNLATHDKRDSTGICFIGERPFREFLARYLQPRTGSILDAQGRAVGEHRGAAFYTIGQRHGLGIGGVASGREGAWYVFAKDMAANTVHVVQGHDHPLLMSDRLWAREVRWVAGRPPTTALRLTARTRYRQPDQRCLVEPQGDDRVTVQFERPQRAVTPGQSVVFYADEVCLGGGVIERTARTPLGAAAPAAAALA